jgi:mannose-6-phosphate isomerase-like protein (cupin superfamily)
VNCNVAEEARLEETGSGLVPATEGWFVANVRDTAWRVHDTFGADCRFEGPDAPFSQLGINICVLEPGQPNCRYHRESLQEDFLVLAGECLLLVEEQERRLRAWDFVHCPPGHRPRLRRCRRRALRHPHGRREERRRRARLPGLCACPSTWRRRRLGDGVAGPGIRLVSGAELREARQVDDASLGYPVTRTPAGAL